MKVRELVPELKLTTLFWFVADSEMNSEPSAEKASP